MVRQFINLTNVFQPVNTSSKTKRFVFCLILFILLPFLICSCGSSPKPEGKDFISQEEKYGAVGQGRGNAFVSPWALKKVYRKVAVMPFRAPVELVGASIADMVATEILKTYKYELIERSQMEQVLEEQSLGLKGVTDSTLAMQIGKILGIEGVIVGTIPEYGMRAVGKLELPAVGINIRMIDAESGSIIWTVTDSAVSKEPISISAFARHMVESIVYRLKLEWIRAGDTFAINLPTPKIISFQGGIRKTIIEVSPDSRHTFKSYTLLRSRTKDGPFTEIATIANEQQQKILFEDKNLLDGVTYYYQVSAATFSGLSGKPAGPFQITTLGAPEPITEFSVEGNRIREILLNWTPASDSNVTGYIIYRSEQKNGPFTKVVHIKDRQTKQYLDKGRVESASGGDQVLKDNTKYFYKIQSINIVNYSSPDSPIVSATTRGVPEPVGQFDAQSNLARKILLRWTPTTDPVVKGYILYRSQAEFGPFDKISFINGKEKDQYMDKGKNQAWSDRGALEDDTTYFYKIRSVNMVDVQSPDSKTVSATTKSIPIPVRGFNANKSEVKQITLYWQPNPERDIEKYELYRGERAGSVEKEIKTVSSEINEFIDPNLENGKTYFYKIRAVDRDNLRGKFSEIIESTTKPIPKTPSDLTTSMDENELFLAWKPNPEKDIAFYRVFMKGFINWEKIGETTEPQFIYAGEIKKGKEIRFRVTAVDQTNLESNPSIETLIEIPK
jgi:hypothetical protein